MASEPAAHSWQEAADYCALPVLSSHHNSMNDFSLSMQKANSLLAPGGAGDPFSLTAESVLDTAFADIYPQTSAPKNDTKAQVTGVDDEIVRPSGPSFSLLLGPSSCSALPPFGTLQAARSVLGNMTHRPSTNSCISAGTIDGRTDSLADDGWHEAHDTVVTHAMHPQYTPQGAYPPAVQHPAHVSAHMTAHVGGMMTRASSRSLQLELAPAQEAPDAAAYDSGEDTDGGIPGASGAGSHDCSARQGAGNVKREMTLEMLRTVYHLPINDAAKQLGIGVTVLKKYCRKFGVKRWPYRKLKSMDKLIKSVEYMTGEDGSGMASEAVQELRRQRELMEQLPSFDMDIRTKKLRQANFKFEYKQRQSTKSSR